MSESLPKFLSMSNTQALKGGQSAKVTIETVGAQPFTIEIHHRNIDDIVRHLTLVAIDAAKMRRGGREPPSFDEKPAEFIEIPANQIGVKISSNPDSVLFVVRIAELDLAYEIPISKVSGLGDALLRLEKTLGPGPQSQH